MAGNAKSQWEFGELFPKETFHRILTVAELTSRIRQAVERDVGEVWVTGEVTNYRLQQAGHAYFTLKDASAQLSCVLFRGENVPHRELLRDGQKVLLFGEVTVYEPRGQYQLIVRAVEMQGVGALQIAFEKLKSKLQAEGLFDTARKRPIPKYPQRIGLVTSPTGAALGDVLHVIERRHPGLELILATCRVQGEGAAAEIACAIELLNQWSAADLANRLDLILLTRGGGSLEDLWAFNEEVVARAIFHSRLPVISAVGHEIDFTISDFVADFRAATPSAAAELLTESFVLSRARLTRLQQDLRQTAVRYLRGTAEQVTSLAQRLKRAHPLRRLREHAQHLDELHSALVRCARSGLRSRRQGWLHLQQRLALLKPSLVIARRQHTLQQLDRRLRNRLGQGLDQAGRKLSALEARLRLLSPESVLNRGYSITLKADSGKVVRSAREVRAGERLRTRLKSGEITSTAEDPPN